MSKREPGWDLFRTFLAVMEAQSLSGAARRLGLTQPSVGRQIDELESALELDLFTRSPRGLIPTAAAFDLTPHAQAMAMAGAALLRAASGEAAAETGDVRISASEIVGCAVLPPILAGFRNAHRGIDIELVLSNRTEDLLRRQADIAVRMVRPTQSQLVTRKIGAVGIGLYAHKTYIAANGTPSTLADMQRHCLIGFDRDDHSYRSVGGKSALMTRAMFGFRCDSDFAQLAAVRAGVGIGGVQDNIARTEPDLVPVLRDDVHFELELWLAMHEDLRATRRIWLLFDHLSQGLTRYIQGN